jgi:signal transduction histidine kinase
MPTPPSCTCSLARVLSGERGRRISTLLGRVARTGGAGSVRLTDLPDTVQDATLWDVSAWSAGEDDGLVLEIRPCGERDDDASGDLIRRVNQRLLSAALQQQEWAEKAEAASVAKSEFLAMVSHELRTPLAGIVGYTDLLLNPGLFGDLNERQSASVMRLQECSRHLWRLVDDLLEVAALDAARTSIETERVDLRGLVLDATGVVQPLAEKKGIRIDVAVPEDVLPIETDTRKVTQILLNVLGNAVKFTDEGSVRLDVRNEGDALRIDVADTGIGIETGDLERIFEPFVQAQEVTTRRHGGTGLGLAISRGLARTLGGDVVATSNPGRGSTFSIRLPQRPAGADAASSGAQVLPP